MSEIRDKKIELIRGLRQPAENKPLKKREKTAELPKDRVELSRGAKKLRAEPAELKAAKLSAAQKSPKQLTVLIYSGMDDSVIQPAFSKNLAELEKLGSDENINLVVQLDRGKTRIKKDSGAKRYYLIQEKKGGLNSPQLCELGQVDMADPKVLSDFIRWGMKKYPARQYMVILGGHGGAWRGAITDKTHKSQMTTPQIEKALKAAEKQTNRKIDVLGFDSCYMASTEVAHQLKDLAKFLVASEAIEPINKQGMGGWQLAGIIGKVKEEIKERQKIKKTLSPKELARLTVEAGIKKGGLQTLSAVDLSRMKKLSQSVDKLAKAILNSSAPPGSIRQIFWNAQGYWVNLNDLYDACQRIVELKIIKDRDLKKAASEVIKNLKAAVIAEKHTAKVPRSHGLQIHGPNIFKAGRLEEYRQLAFAQDTDWEKLLENYQKLPGSITFED